MKRTGWRGREGVGIVASNDLDEKLEALTRICEEAETGLF